MMDRKQMKRRAGCIAAIISTAVLGGSAEAQIATNATRIPGGTWVSLGTGPLYVQAISDPISIAVSDSQPATTTGFALTVGSVPFVAQSTSTVWVRTPLVSGTFVITAPANVAIGSGGSGGSVTQGTSPWATSILGTLPAFATVPAFRIDQTTPGYTNLVQVGGTLPSFASPPAVAQSGNWNVTNISGTISLPNGAATSANQSTEIATLNAIDAGIPAALGQTTMSASMPVAIASNQSAVPALQSGTWTVQPGNIANTTPWLATIGQGGNSAIVSATGALKIDGSAATQPVSASVLPLPTGAATSSNQPSNAAQGSTTLGQTGTLAQGAVTAAAPTYVSGQTNPLSLTPSGLLRVDASSTAQSVLQSGTWNVGSEGIGNVVSMATATAYVANNSVGGLQSLSVFRTNGGGGTLGKIRVGFKGTSQTPNLVIYVWEANPTTTTCANGTPFSAGAADWPNLVDAYSVTTAAPAGTTMTTGSVDIATPVKNRDGSSTTNLYVCVVTGSPLTTAANDMTLTLRVSQD
jgi:hypothetical protein